MKLLRQPIRFKTPQSNGITTKLGAGVVPTIDVSGNVLYVTVAGGTIDSSGNPTNWTGPAAYDLTIPGAGPMSGTYRLWCQGPAYYSLVRCGDDQGCRGGEGAVYGLAISMAPDCLTPYYPGAGQPPVCGNWGLLSCPDGSVPIPPAYGMLLQVNWQAMPVSFNRDAAFEAMNNCAASGDGLTLADSGTTPQYYPAPFFEAYESGHWVSVTQSGGGFEPDSCGTCGTLVAQAWTAATAPQALAGCVQAVGGSGGSGGGTGLTFYNFLYSCPDAPLLNYCNANQYVYGGNYPTAGPTAAPVTGLTVNDLQGCCDKYDCYAQVIRQEELTTGSEPAPITYTYHTPTTDGSLNGSSDYKATYTYNGTAWVETVGPSVGLVLGPGGPTVLPGWSIQSSYNSGAFSPGWNPFTFPSTGDTMVVTFHCAWTSPSGCGGADMPPSVPGYVPQLALPSAPTDGQTATATYTTPQSAPCCLEIEFAGVRPGGEVSVYGYQYGYPNADGVANPSGYLNRRLKFRRTQCVNGIYYGSGTPEPTDVWAAQPYGGLNPFPGTLAVAANPKIITLSQTLTGQTPVAGCQGGTTMTVANGLNITGYIVVATLSGSEGVIREPTLPAPSSGAETTSAPLAEAQGVTFSGTLPGNGAQAAILALIAAGWVRTDNSDQTCADLAGLYVDPSMPIGTGCLCVQSYSTVYGIDPGTGDEIEICQQNNSYVAGLAGPPIKISDLDGTGTGGTTAWHMTPLPGPGACSDYRGTDYWTTPATATIHVPSLSGDALGTADTDFFNCVNEEENDPTANVLGWRLDFTDLLGRAQELVFWANDGQWTNPLVPWRITREPPLMRRDGATLVRLRTGHSKYAFDRGFCVPTSWYDSAGNHPLDLCAGTPCLGAPLTNTLFSSLPADPDDHCTAVNDSGQCIAYDDPQMLIYRYNFLDAGFMPGSTLSLTPICQPAGDSCPEPPPAQCNQIDAVNIFGLPWGDVVLYPTVSGSRQPPFAATNQHGWDYLLTRTADGPIGQATFQLTITAHGAGSPTYACTCTTGKNFDAYYAGWIPLTLPGLATVPGAPAPGPYLEFYFARDCDAVAWQLTLHGSSADGHDWSAGSPVTVPAYSAVGAGPNTLSPGWFHLPANAEAPGPGDTARRVDIVRTVLSGVVQYTLVVSDWYQASGDTATRWHHLFCVLGSNCCVYTSGGYTGQHLYVPQGYPFSACETLDSGVTVDALPQKCLEQCTTTQWTLARGPLTFQLTGSSSAGWTLTRAGGVVARAQPTTGSGFQIDWAWTDGTNYLPWSAQVDLNSLPQAVTFASSTDPTAWPATVSLAGGNWTITFAWGALTFAAGTTSWEGLGSLAFSLTEQPDAGGHGRFALTVTVAGDLTIGRAFADPYDTIRDCEAIAALPVELSDANNYSYGTVTISGS